MPRTTYTSEYREDAVKIALSSNDTIANTARNLGINESTLHNWVNKAVKNKTTESKSSKKSANKLKYNEYEKEIRNLKKALKKAEMERDILKKAAAYFANQEL